MNTAPQQTPKLTVKGHVPIVAERFACLELEEQETTDTESEYTERSASLSEEKVAHGGGHSLDEDEFDLFCTLIECNLSEILSTWKDMLKHEIRPITAAAITNCIYNEISSSLEQARLLAPHWFNEEFLMRKDDMFHEGLNIIFEREKDSLWNSVMDVAIKMDRSIVPIFVGDFIYSFVMVRSGLKDRDFYIFRFSVGLRLLRLIQSVEGNEKSRVDELQEDTYKALDFLHNVMSHPMTPKFTCQGVDKVIQEAKRLRPIVQGLREPSILCSITLWSVVQVQEVFMQLLGNPLIAMTAHIYVYLRISNLVGPTPQLESFCTKHESMLFWNCRPLTLKDWGISYERWVIPREETAEEIACLRLKRYKSNFLMREFSLNDFKLTNDLKNKFSSQPGKIFDTMRLELEREMPSNTVVLYDSVSEIVRVIFRSQLGFPPSIAIEDVQLAYMFYKYIDRVAEPFILRLKEMQDFA
ncbi:hypothetical protein N7471_010280 [Penicillium samsonianum]|uniref:uncharacterized protein n=1 Tax=Penicillium samsonianum TaxID=1882272 RepID=UPI002549844A|nr:uncharacterized protein N7471_010280 [Penicillium samsonianum]KAJ6125787.1 hypothetical protein N7471_010280 [Penicillium samsonianum]